MGGFLRQKSPVGMALAFALTLTACGMKPFENPNHREEGPENGLFSGPEGEWVIYRKVEPEKRKDQNGQRTQ